MVDSRAARTGRTDRARDGGRRHRPDQARLGMAGAPPRAVPAPRHRGRRHPPLARLLAHLRSRRAGRPHLDHPQARRRRARSRRSSSAASAPGRSSASGGVEGTFVLPDPAPERLLFISAGSGITPIMSMLRALADAGELARRRPHPLLTHAGGVIFAHELRALDAAPPPAIACTCGCTGEQGRVAPGQLDELCPDWAERETFMCGPAGLLEDLGGRWRERRRRSDGCTSSTSSPTARSATASAGRAARSASAGAPSRRQRRRAADPASPGSSAGATLPLRLSDGHLPQLRRSAALRSRARPAHRPRPRPTRRNAAHLHQRARGRGRDRALSQPEKAEDRTWPQPSPQRSPVHRTSRGAREPARAPLRGADRAARA